MALVEIYWFLVRLKHQTCIWSTSFTKIFPQWSGTVILLFSLNFWKFRSIHRHLRFFNGLFQSTTFVYIAKSLLSRRLQRCRHKVLISTITGNICVVDALNSSEKVTKYDNKHEMKKMKYIWRYVTISRLKMTIWRLKYVIGCDSKILTRGRR